MKIVVLDGYTENPGDLSWGELEKLGELTVYDRTSVTDENEIISRIGDAEVVITNKTPITKNIMDACPGIKYIAMLATGYNVVDYVYAREKGIPLSNVPSYGTASVGQFAIAMLLELCHHVGFHSDCVKAGEWTRSRDWCFWKYPLTELAGKTMGIIGFGRIGRRTAVIAQALGMKVLAFDRYQDKGLETDSCRYADLEELLSGSDVISLHCPLFPETEKIINRRTIEKMKDGVLIINTSRGQLVEEADLREGLDSGKIGGAAVDVVSAEPIQEDNPLLGAENILITPHIAWAPRESRQRLMDIAVENLSRFMSGTPQNVVNEP